MGRHFRAEGETPSIFVSPFSKFITTAGGGTAVLPKPNPLPHGRHAAESNEEDDSN
ncbi:hypothetical protein HWD32_gp63 [Gordonia phage Secretariat]|uniref:Uncharacterized protein n=1 Tax=Gordonia phage Secretariat TaxID=2725616 RepID=A0A6M3SXK1_9CAUD|nr:hypothetical protein HWD32_gp63 [Gordonia phage Secretariat]QJD49662.1 hypothetical protein SEA_SECRETARIAT_63 [Gordonia phage Secretariat]